MSIHESSSLSYLGKLMPVQIMPSVEFEDEGIIDLGTIPYLTVETEKKKE